MKNSKKILKAASIVYIIGIGIAVNFKLLNFIDNWSSTAILIFGILVFVLLIAAIAFLAISSYRNSDPNGKIKDFQLDASIETNAKDVVSRMAGIPFLVKTNPSKKQLKFVYIFLIIAVVIVVVGFLIAPK
jgi:hypothetical protein